MKKKDTPPKPARYLGLARVSSREQEREGFRLETQDQEIRRYVERTGGEVVRIWLVAETATRREERKMFREFIAYARAHAHELSTVLVTKVGRGARNLRDYLELE